MKLVESISVCKKTLGAAASMFSISPTIAENICHVYYCLSLSHFCYFIMMSLKNRRSRKFLFLMWCKLESQLNFPSHSLMPYEHMEKVTRNYLFSLSNLQIVQSPVQSPMPSKCNFSEVGEAL